ncbi:polymeric immunoglobulin receptor-like isoform X3 [Brachyhypopomus gauderio]|uniref:polymeric immunoglobulin receptor-like isoform X3 n=1 Tax=Brachyhypopomus gauderio TaxID=698409 RepID=UPI004041D38D
MKILLIFAFYLFSGPVGCVDVIGYSGGHLEISCRREIYGMSSYVFFCKRNFRNDCEHLIYTQTLEINQWVYKGRFALATDSGGITVIIKQLDLHDAGLYQCGDVGGWHHDINLKVNTDRCCTAIKTIPSYLGETTTISCTYPEVFESYVKGFHKLKGDIIDGIIESSGSESHSTRFSMSDDRGAKVITVNISDVSESDGGVYYCGVRNEVESFSYHSLFTQIQLHVNEERIPRENPESQNGSTKSTDSQKSVNSGISQTEIIYEEIKDPKPSTDIRAPAELHSTVQVPTIISVHPNTVYVTAQLPTILSDPGSVRYSTELPAIIPAGRPSTPASFSDPADIPDVTVQVPTQI